MDGIKKRINFYIEEKTGCFIITSHKPGKRGYPRTNTIVNGRRVVAPLHRAVYEFFNGNLPHRKNLIVLHSCDNKMCINPKHLRLGTHKENASDAIKNKKIPIGEDRPNSKLDPIKVRQIRSLYAQGMPQKEIAGLFMVGRGLISNVIRGKAWIHVM